MRNFLKHKYAKMADNALIDTALKFSQQMQRNDLYGRDVERAAYAFDEAARRFPDDAHIYLTALKILKYF